MDLKHQPGAQLGTPAGAKNHTATRARARTAGVFYVLEGATSAFGALHVVSEVKVSGNAAATAENVITHEPLMWAGFTAALVAVACHIIYTVLFYELFKPVSRTLSLVAAAISLVAAALQAGAALFQAAPLLIVRSGGYLNVFTTGQRDALTLAFPETEHAGLRHLPCLLRDVARPCRLPDRQVDLHAADCRNPRDLRWAVLPLPAGTAAGQPPVPLLPGPGLHRRACAAALATHRRPQP